MSATPAQGFGARHSAGPISILIVDDEQTTRELCAAAAAEIGLHALAVASAEQALSILEERTIDILLTDLKLQGMNGIELLKRASELHPHVSVLVLTQYGTIDSAIEAGRIGARDYISRSTG